jgi:hypothetical protein
VIDVIKSRHGYGKRKPLDVAFNALRRVYVHLTAVTCPRKFPACSPLPYTTKRVHARLLLGWHVWFVDIASMIVCDGIINLTLYS